MHVYVISMGSMGDTLPFVTIGRAMAIARNLPGADTIHVAEGTYREPVVMEEDELTLLGGYIAGGGVRDPGAHPTIVDGGASGPAILVSSQDGTNVLVNVTIDGFTLTNGRSFQRGGAAFGGAGVLIEEAQVTLTNNVITGNVADGAGAKLCSTQGGSASAGGASSTVLGCAAAGRGCAGLALAACRSWRSTRSREGPSINSMA